MNEKFLNKIIQGDCLEVMQQLENCSIQMILCDLPYQITANTWDSMIPFNELWMQYERIITDNGAIVLTAQQPFTSALLMSNIKHYRHRWIWNKNNSAGFATAKIRPFQICEDVLVFSKKKVNYYPIMEQRGKPRKKGGYSKSTNYELQPTQTISNLYYPKNLLHFSNAVQKGKLHPTEKPLDLFKYLLQTYSKPNDTILDNCIGSGTTAIAALELGGRDFIGIEKDENYCSIAMDRIKRWNDENQRCCNGGDFGEQI